MAENCKATMISLAFDVCDAQIAFTSLVYPCLMLAYLGEAAFLSRHHEDIQRSFYKAIPGKTQSIHLGDQCLW